ncbi:MAG: hypothetical protein GAK28_04257 [Luteibacter sp.]|uniref:VOC family protein n=1 Tax=Luteibacter sp. TaxID=1886636 RepID=UPI001384F466|nr:VOC family protein [Luteibacter sp.]KAF1004093.1 MAG: hypothetical protein GAK28_04257 [Luteibacter sp.]
MEIHSSSAVLAPPGTERRAQAPRGLNHLLLHVSSIEASHRFYTDLLGFRHVATSTRPRADHLAPMRFYSGVRDGQVSHHDFALYEVSNLDTSSQQRLDHLAIEYGSEQEWIEQIRFLHDHGVRLHTMIERGPIWSIHTNDPDGLLIELVYERPRTQWEADLDAALNTSRRHDDWQDMFL